MYEVEGMEHQGAWDGDGLGEVADHGTGCSSTFSNLISFNAIELYLLAIQSYRKRVLFRNTNIFDELRKQPRCSGHTLVDHFKDFSAFVYERIVPA